MFTEEAWLAGKDANEMLAQTHQLPWSERRSELFLCAACRHLTLTPWAERVIEAFERQADGGPKVGYIWSEFGEPPQDGSQRFRDLFGRLREGAQGRVLWLVGLGLGKKNMDFAPFIPLIRCHYGNPFRQLVAKPRGTVRALGERCYSAFPRVDSAAFDVLADALEEANELDAAAHCRSGPHWRGCHAVEWARART